MTIYYFTTDSEYNWINQNADISTTDNLDSLAAELNESAWGLKVIDWEDGGFGDCWVKCFSEPEVDDDGYAEIDGIKCYVAAPGTHPGDNAWWLTPAVTVMVPVWEVTE